SILQAAVLPKLQLKRVAMAPANAQKLGKMNFKNVRIPNVPGGGAASALIKFGAIAGLGIYGAANSLYNVDGGNRAIVFNRIIGVKDK
ncbi:unnamed protein product, partial [Ilex paraguariensis]